MVKNQTYHKDINTLLITMVFDKL